MYNEKQKKQFFEYYETTRDVNTISLYSYFETASIYEEMIGKDICDFILFDISNFLKFWSKGTINSLIDVSSKFNIYTDWCQKNYMAKIETNHWKELNNDIFLSCLNKNLVNQQMITREEIYEYAKKLKNAKDKVILLSPFEGILGDDMNEMIELDISNIDEENNQIILDNRRIDVPKMYIDYALRAINMYDYYTYGNDMVKHLDPSDKYVIKPIYSAKTDGRNNIQKSVRNIFRNIKDYLNLNDKITITSTYMAGMIDFVNEQAKKDNVEPLEWMFIKGNDAKIKNKYSKFNKTMLRKQLEAINTSKS